jgi:hypothetical protein
MTSVIQRNPPAQSKAFLCVFLPFCFLLVFGLWSFLSASLPWDLVQSEAAIDEPLDRSGVIHPGEGEGILDYSEQVRHEQVRGEFFGIPHQVVRKVTGVPHLTGDDVLLPGDGGLALGSHVHADVAVEVGDHLLGGPREGALRSQPDYSVIPLGVILELIQNTGCHECLSA